MLLLVLAAIFAAFTLSASAGFGGSLILVPALSLMLGVKKGVAVAALLLAGNNVAKAVAYRSTIPWRASAAVVVLTLLGSLLGAAALVAAPERLVAVAVAAGIVAALVVEPTQPRLRRAAAPLLAFGAGAASGFSGTSGRSKAPRFVRWAWIEATLSRRRRSSRWQVTPPSRWSTRALLFSTGPGCSFLPHCR